MQSKPRRSFAGINNAMSLAIVPNVEVMPAESRSDSYEVRSIKKQAVIAHTRTVAQAQQMADHIAAKAGATQFTLISYGQTEAVADQVLQSLETDEMAENYSKFTAVILNIHQHGLARGLQQFNDVLDSTVSRFEPEPEPPKPAGQRNGLLSRLGRALI